MSKECIQKLCEYLDENKVKNYPICNHFLTAETDYIKNVYFKMLAVILQAGNEIGEGQRNLFERQIIGGECELSVSELFRQALDFEIDEYVNFTKQLVDMPIKYRFILDALLLTGIDSQDTSQLKLIANFVESLQITKDELQFISILAKALLEQSVAGYVTAEQQYTTGVPNNVAKEYVDTIIQQNVYGNDSITIIESFHPLDISIDMLEIISKKNTPKIRLKNIQINISQYSLSFGGYDEVIIENCVFEEGKYPVNFTGCNKVIVKKQCFQKFY